MMSFSSLKRGEKASEYSEFASGMRSKAGRPGLGECEVIPTKTSQRIAEFYRLSQRNDLVFKSLSSTEQMTSWKAQRRWKNYGNFMTRIQAAGSSYVPEAFPKSLAMKMLQDHMAIQRFQLSGFIEIRK